MSQPAASYRLVRPDDHLDLLVITHNLVEVEGAPGQPPQLRQALTSGGQVLQGSIALQFEPQHVIEWAGSGQPRPIFGDRTTVRFVLSPGETVPLSVEGLLATVRRLALTTPPSPQPQDQLTARPTGPDGVPADARPAALVAAPATQRPGGTEDPLLVERERRTAALLPRLAAPVSPAAADEDPVQGPTPPPTTELHFPSRLVMRPLGLVGFVHAAEPVAHDGRVELWHTRLGQWFGTGTVEQPTALRVIATLESPGGTSAWAGRVSDQQIDNALREADRKNLRDQTPVAALTNHRTVLSAHGAWLDVEGEWDDDLLAYEHQLTQGRDTFVRTAARGTLYPLGHQALDVEVTRRVPPQRDGEVARLVTTRVIVVKQREKAYADSDRIDRGWPWRSVRIESRRAGGPRAVIATGSGGRQVELPLNDGGTPYAFDCVGTDRGGRVSRFALPLYFVPDGFGSLSVVEAVYRDGETRPAGQPPKFGGEPLRTVSLRGQTVAVAPVVAGASDAADLVADVVRLVPTSTIQAGVAAARPVVDQLVGRIPALDQLVPGAGAVARPLEWASAYLDHAFGAGNVGETLLRLAPGGVPAVVDLARRELTGGLVGPKYALTGLSRSLGPVGGNLADLAAGNFKPADLFGAFLDKMKLFGVFGLRQLIGAETLQTIADAPRLASRTLDGVTKPHLSWRTPLFKGVPAGKGVEVGVGPVRGTLRRRRVTGQDREAVLSMTVDTEIDVVAGSMRHVAVCEVTDVELAFSLQGEDQLVVPVQNITFESRDGQQVDVDVNLGQIQFLGVLGYVRTLADLIPADGFSDPPALDVRSDGITSSFSLPLPPVATGVFVLENIALHSRLDLFFGGEAPTFELAFARPDSPFRLTVIALGGGGWIAVKVAADGFRHLAGALEFGAAVAVDLGVARGSVSAMGGLAFFVDGDGFARLTAYFTVRGELRVLGLITVSAELTLSLTYESPPPRLFGRAELVVKVKVLFLKKTVRIEFEKTFAGADPAPAETAGAALGTGAARALAAPSIVPPTFADVMAPRDASGERPWDTYCLMYAD